MSEIRHIKDLNILSPLQKNPNKNILCLLVFSVVQVICVCLVLCTIDSLAFEAKAKIKIPVLSDLINKLILP